MPIIGIIASAANVSVVYNYAVAGADGTLYLSSDAISWDVKPIDQGYVRGAAEAGYYVDYINNTLYGNNGVGTATSTDGLTWTFQKSNLVDIQDAVYANNQYVMVSNRGELATSPDFSVWTYRTIPNYARDLYGIDYGNGTYVAAGNEGAIYTSTDAITWTDRSTGVTTEYFRDVIYANNLWVAVGFKASDAGLIRTSTDAVSWTARTPATGATAAREIKSITYGNGYYVTTVYGATSSQYSTDGITWTVGTNIATDYTDTWKVVYKNSKFVLSGGSRTIWTSTDGVTWTSIVDAMPSGYAPVYDITWNGTRWIFATEGEPTALDNIVTSTDLVTFTANTSSVIWNRPEISALGYFNGIYIAGGNNSAYGEPAYLVTSTDGLTWTTRNPQLSTRGARDIAYGNSTYVLVATGGLVSTSTDAVTWTNRTSGTTSNLTSAIYAGSQFVIGGNSGAIRTSTDGITWTTRTSTFSTVNINDLAYGTSTYVAVGANGRIASSTDAVTWTSRTSNFSTTAINGVIFGNEFVAVGATAKVATSTDGITWTTRTSAISSNYNLLKVSYKNGVYVTVGSITSSNIANNLAYYQTSTDGITWTQRELPTSAENAMNVTIGL